MDVRRQLIAVFVGLACSVPVRADDGVEAPVFDLADCLVLAQEQQPALQAWRASLRAAQVRKEAVDQLRLPGLVFNRDLRVRREQARLGVIIGAAGVHQENHETAYDVTRTYYSVIYARIQLRLVRAVIKDLSAYHLAIEQALIKKKVPLADMAHDLIVLYLNEAKSKEYQALKGVDLATAALREAMGVDADFCFQVKEQELPTPLFDLTQEQIVELALTQHGEMLEAFAAAEAFGLEVKAQARMFFPTTKRTAGSSSDIHAQEVPLGEHNGDYRPGAVALEMPVTMFGLRKKRVAWAEALSDRADAVAIKTRNLIRLDAINAYLTWRDTAKEVVIRREAAEVGRRLAQRITANFAVDGQTAIEYLISHNVVATRAQARYNEALYLYVLALADLERVTAGGFQAGLACPR